MGPSHVFICISACWLLKMQEIVLKFILGLPAYLPLQKQSQTIKHARTGNRVYDTHIKISCNLRDRNVIMCCWGSRPCLCKGHGKYTVSYPRQGQSLATNLLERSPRIEIKNRLFSHSILWIAINRFVFILDVLLNQ